MNLQPVQPAANRIKLFCDLCEKVKFEIDMLADLDQKNRYVCKCCADAAHHGEPHE